jgi:hypothetical protein
MGGTWDAAIADYKTALLEFRKLIAGCVDPAASRVALQLAAYLVPTS